MNLDDHNSNEQKNDKKLHYYEHDWPQQQQQHTLSPAFTPQQFYLPPPNLPSFNLLPEQDYQDKTKPKYPFRKLSAGEAPDQQEDEQFRHPYNQNQPYYPQPFKYPQNHPYMQKYPQPYPPPWFRPPYPQFYYPPPPYDMSQYQNTLSKELQSKVTQLVQYQKVSPFQCNCKKSKCLKLYCECFANNWVCSQSCNCTECKNRIDNPNERSKAIEEALLRNPEAFATILTNNGQQPQIVQEQKSQKEIQKDAKKGCNCKKSECKKKYCECYSINQKCTELCKCENCLNKEEPIDNQQPIKQESEKQPEIPHKNENQQSKQDKKSKKIKKDETPINNTKDSAKKKKKN